MRRKHFICVCVWRTRVVISPQVWCLFTFIRFSCFKLIRIANEMRQVFFQSLLHSFVISEASELNPLFTWEGYKANTLGFVYVVVFHRIYAFLSHLALSLVLPQCLWSQPSEAYSLCICTCCSMLRVQHLKCLGSCVEFRQCIVVK